MTSAAFSPDGKRVVTGSEDKTVIVWDAETGKNLLTLKGHTVIVWCVRFSPDGSEIVSAGDAISADMTKALPGEARIWNANTGANLYILKGHEEGAIFAAEFSPEGRYIVTAGEDMTVRLWETESGKEVKVIKGDTAPFFAVAFSPDGKRIASVNDGGMVKIEKFPVLSAAPHSP